MAEWGTPVMMMLGRVGRAPSSSCAACTGAQGMQGLGDPYSRALPAGSVAGAGGFGLGALPPGMGPEPWAAYPGSGGPNAVYTDLNAPSPDWLRNSITMPVISPADPQNRQLVFNSGLYNPTWTPRQGSEIRDYAISGLGQLVTPWEGSRSDFTMGVRGLNGLRGGLGCMGPRFNLYGILGATVAAAHGYARTKNVGWTAAWALFGYVMPLFTATVAIVQGLGKSKSGG